MPTNLLTRYRALLRGADAWFARCADPAGPAIRCAAGCSACCRSLFDITFLDALLLQKGLALLPSASRLAVLDRAGAQLLRIQRRWPEFVQPYLLNDLPTAGWDIPEEDDSPCPLLSAGKCLLYDYRPLTCRLHGLAHVDISGEIFEEKGCTLNEAPDPRTHPALRWEFRQAFGREARLLRKLADHLGRRSGELDTFIASALLIDFDQLGARRQATGLTNTPLISPQLR